MRQAFSLDKLVSAVALIMTLFHLYVIVMIPFPMDRFKNFNIMFSLVVFFLLQLQRRDRSGPARAVTVGLLFLSLAATLYIELNFKQIALLMGIMDLPATIVGTILLVVVWESARRFWGLLIPGFVVVTLLYAYFGNYLPDPFYHGGISFERLIGYSSMFFRGILGRLTGIGATLVFPLFIFANLLDVLGGRDMFLRAGRLLAARFRSGPAQGAVLCSLFMGSITGSVTANVATTGSFTIPMMKSAGYKPTYAAAVESVASTGGQFMPPIMGSVAFAMVGLTGIPYGTIAIAALLPALLYYAFVSLSVELRAHRDQVAAPPVVAANGPSDSPWKVLWDYFHLLLAVVFLVYLLLIRYPASMSVVYGIVCLVLFVCVRTLSQARDRLQALTAVARETMKGLVDAATTGAPLFLFFALVNVAIEMLVVTGLAQKFSNLLISISGGNFLLLLVFAAVACIIFGMGMPSVSAYILVALLGAPALVEAGSSVLAAHMFVFFVASLSAITPPVAIAPMVASGIAKCDFWPAALASVRLGLPGFILPFYFMYRPALLVVDSSTAATVAALFCVAAALVALSIALEGYCFRTLNRGERLCLLLLAGLLLWPEPITSWVGAAMLVALLAFAYRTRRPASQGAGSVHSGELAPSEGRAGGEG